MMRFEGCIREHGLESGLLWYGFEGHDAGSPEACGMDNQDCDRVRPVCRSMITRTLIIHAFLFRFALVSCGLAPPTQFGTL